jgi:hypothetical protein
MHSVMEMLYIKFLQDLYKNVQKQVLKVNLGPLVKWPLKLIKLRQTEMAR